MKARYYDPQAGRFMGIDPVGPLTVSRNNRLMIEENPMSFNRYLYVNNNPYRYTDPSGKCIWDLCVGEAALIYGGTAVVGIVTGLFIAEEIIQPAIEQNLYKDKTEKPKAKVGNSEPGDIVRTPDTHPNDFSAAGGGKKKNVNTGEIWSPSNTNHSGSDGGEWKVGTKPGVPARPGSKITVEGGESGGKIIKVDK